MKPWMKKVLIGVGIFFGLLVLAAIIIPMVVNVDDYRPKIIETANSKINGKLDLGKLTLSLWGTIKVGVDGVALKDAAGRNVVSSKDVFITVPWTSILGGAPLLTLTMNAPELSVIKDKNGKLNVMTLMKTDQGAAPPEAKEAPAAPPSEPGKLPGIAMRARLGVDMKNAKLVYADQKSGLNSQVNNLNVLMKDVSLSHATTAEISADLDTKMGKTMTVKGPAKLSVQGEPVFEGGNLKQTNIQMTATLNDLEIVMPELFEKKKGVPANAEGKFHVNPETAVIDALVLKFFNAEISITGGVTEMGKEGVDPKMEVAFKSNEIPLKPWSELVPMLKEYELGGTANLSGNATSQGEKLAYKADVAVKAMTAKAPSLKAQPQVDASIIVITDQIESMKVKMTSPGNQLDIVGRMVSFERPKLDITVTSPGMDLDQLVDFPKSTASANAAAAKGGGGEAKGAGGGPAGSAKASDFDAMLDPLRKSPIAKEMTANIKVKMDFVKAYNAKMTNLTGSLSMKGLTASLDSFSMGLWGGSGKANAVFQLAPKAPTYKFAMEASKVDLKQAVSSQMELFKNTVQGIAAMKMDGTGASLNPEPAKKNLNVKGTMKIDEATFATIDIGKMVTEAVNKATQGLQGKIPGFNGKGMNPPNNVDSKYESITSDYTIANSVFTAPNFFGKAMPNRGFDIRGNTTLNIVDYTMNADWEVIDTYNLTQAKNMNVNIAGSNVNHILTEGDQPLKLPIKVSGTCFAPSINYAAVPEALAKVALKNVQVTAENRVKDEVKKKAEEAAKGALQGLGKKLFGK